MFPALKKKSTYIICASHRSGSTLLCEGLRHTWHCGDPKEYLSPTRSVAVHEQGEIGTDPREDFPGYVREVLRVKRFGNGIFGLKVMWKHVRMFPRRMGLPIAMSDHRRLARGLREVFGSAHFIWSRREDKVRQAVSLVRAKQTRLFTHQQREKGAFDEAAAQFDFAAVDEEVKRFQHEEREWQTFFERAALKPLIVTYEEFIQDYEGTVDRALRHIGLRPEELEIQSPRFSQKLADETTEQWIEQYKRESAL